MNDFTRWFMRMSIFHRRFSFLRSPPKDRVCEFADTLHGPFKRCPRRLRLADSTNCECKLYETLLGVDYTATYAVCTWPVARGGGAVKKRERQASLFSEQS